MAITRVQSITANSSSSGLTSQNVTFGSVPTAGNIIVLAVAGLGTASIPGTPANISGNASIAWTWAAVTAQGASSTLVGLAIGRVLPGVSSGLVTVNTQTSGGIAVAAAEYSGVSNIFDSVCSAVGSGTSPATGAGTTTQNANELWIAAISVRFSGGVTFSSPTNSYAIVGQDKSSLATTSDRSVCLLERIVSSTGTFASAGATQSGSGAAWAAVGMSLEVTPSGGGVAGNVKRSRQYLP